MHDILLETLRDDGQIGSCPLRCQATEIKSRYHEWEIIGPPQIRRVASASTFSAWRKPSNRVVHRPTAEEPPPNEQPMFVRHLGQEMNAAVSESSAYLQGLTARATITASSGLLRLTGGNHERKMTHRRPKVFLERFFNRIGHKLPLQKTVHFCRKRTYIPAASRSASRKPQCILATLRRYHVERRSRASRHA